MHVIDPNATRCTACTTGKATGPFELCPECYGKSLNQAPVLPEGVIICPYCKGKGEWGSGMLDIPCHKCEGLGQLYTGPMPAVPITLEQALKGAPAWGSVGQPKPLPRYYARLVPLATGTRWGLFRTERRLKGGHLYGSYVGNYQTLAHLLSAVSLRSGVDKIERSL